MKIKIVLLAFVLVGFSTLNAQLPQTTFQVDCFEVPEKAYADEFDEITVSVNVKCKVNDYKLTIYNSWDEIVFESSNPEDIWVASKLPKGVYKWVITANMPNTIPKQTITDEGKITLIQ